MLASYIVEDSTHNFVTLAQIAQWNSAWGSMHLRLHAINNVLDHTSTIAATYVMIADANGLPAQGTNTDAQIASAVSASHARLHSISSTSDHSSTISPTYVMIADANGLPSQGTNTNAQISSAVSASHTQNTDTGTTSSTFDFDSDSVLGRVRIQVVSGAANKLLAIKNTALTDNRTATFQDASGTIAYLSDIPAVTPAWELTGNAGTVDGTNFIGTTDNIPFNIRVNNIKAGRIDQTNAHTFYGYQAGYTNAAVDNTAFGWKSLYYNGSGTRNTAVGVNSLLGVSTGNTTGSTCVGYNSGMYSIGNYNVYIGAFSGYSASALTSTNTFNIGIGYQALYSITTSTATLNVAIGSQACNSLTTGARNISIGANGLYNNSTGDDNVAIGGYALEGFGTVNTSFSIGVGYQAGRYSLGNNNIYIGNCAGLSANLITSTNLQNIGIGYFALSALTTSAAIDNIAIGYQAMSNTTVGYGNVALGRNAFVQNILGYYNVAVGYQALYGVAPGGGWTSNTAQSTAIGYCAGQFSLGNSNVYIGFEAGKSVNATTSTNTNNVAIGYRSMYSVTTSSADYCVAVGWQSVYYNTTGSGNVGIGADAVLYNETGNYNTSLGYYALLGRSGVSYTGSVGIGAFAGRYSLGSYNIYIGYQAGQSASAATSLNKNNIGIGYQSLYSITGTSPISTNSQYNVSIGEAALRTLTTGSYNTALGFNALYSQNTTLNSIGIGAYAGKYETAGNKLYIDSLDRSTEAAGKTNSIIYGVMDATVTNQNLYVNAHLHTMSDSLYHYFGGGDDMSIYYNGTNGYINTSLVAASDLYVSCGTDKTLVLTESVWEDIQFAVSTGKVPAANYPDYDTFTTNTKEYKFDVDDYIDLAANECPHWWKEGTTVYPHLHTTLNGANSTGSNRYVKFTLYIAYAKDNAVWTETTSTVEITIPTGTADMTNLFGTGTSVSLAGQTIGTQIKVRVKRIAATAGTEYANHIFVTQCGIHAEKDTMGSRQVGTK